MNFKVIWVTWVLLLTSMLFGQQKKADSLSALLKTTDGINKVIILNKLADIYQFIDTKDAIKFAEQGITLAKEIDYPKGLAGCYGSLGFAYNNQDNKKAVEYTQKALSIRREINDKAGIATSLNVLGVINYYQANYLTSIEYHLEALKLREEIGDKVKLATSYNNIAIVNLALENYQSALDYLNKALAIRIETNNRTAVGIIKTNIGEVEALMGYPEKALITFKESLIINKELGNHKSTANSHHQMANVYSETDRFEEAKKHFLAALEIYTQLDVKNGISNVRNGMAEVDYKNKNYDAAINNALIAYQNAKAVKALENILTASELLYKSYQRKKNFKKAYIYLQIHSATFKNLKDEVQLNKVAKIELEYQLNKIKKEQEKKLVNQKILILLLIFVLLSGAIIITLISRSSKNKKRANIILNQLNLKLNEANETKDKFFSIIAHDLRGPYQTTLNLSDMLVKNYNELNQTDIQSSIAQLDSSLKNQYGLLTDLLQWSELQAEGFYLKKEEINLSETTNKVIELLTFASKAKDISLLHFIDTELTVAADNNMLRLVLRNLISNSIKFTNNGGEVKIFAERKYGAVTVEVCDNGIGFAQNVLDNLFKIDVQHSNVGTANEKGSGLGLILCKEIIEKHGGTVLVESELGQGSKFIFTLPDNGIEE